MAQSACQYDIGIKGGQRDEIDADLMAQIVIMMGRQLAGEARGQAPRDDETLPARTRRSITGEHRA